MILSNLHIRNIALIKEQEITLRNNLHVFSGETGAGKSIFLKAILLALGASSDSDFIRSGEENASAELTFQIESPAEEEYLRSLSILPENNEVILSRRIYEKKSVSKVNGENVVLSTLRSIGDGFLELCSQKDHVSLLREENHLLFLDRFGGEEVALALERYQKSYSDYRARKTEADSLLLSPEEREKRLAACREIIAELSPAKITPGEEEKLRERYKILSQSKMILESLSSIHQTLVRVDEEELSEAGRLLDTLSKLDERFASYRETLSTSVGFLSDLRAEISNDLSAFSSSGEEEKQIEERLDLLRRLKRKYGGSEESVIAAYEKALREQEELAAYDDKENTIREALSLSRKELLLAAAHLHKVRVSIGEVLSRKMEEAMQDLNFLSVSFRTEITETNHYRKNGSDEVRFFLSLNPGEPLKPLSKIASGGELSRILLSMRSVFAAQEEQIRKALLFDEIDEGISGETAKAVACKLADIAANHQVICISHLPQVVAMADHHYRIEKREENGMTVTEIRELKEEESIRELARLLSAGEVTDIAIQNAREMKARLKGR